MQYRRLGRSGLKLSALSFGAWVTFGQQVDIDNARDMLALAHDHGVNFFDNAETYAAGEAERVMGEALQRLDRPRDSYCVSSKVFFGASEEPLPTQKGLSRKHVREACDQALARLKVDYLDLYFCHRPDPDTPVEETVYAMDTLIRQGKVLYWGTSEWPAERIREAHLIARAHHLHAPSMEQPQYNLLHRDRVEDEYAPLYDEFGMGTTIWSPLSSGLLTGKYNDGVPDDSRLNQPGYDFLREALLEDDGKMIKKVRALKQFADELEVSQAIFAIAWCLKNPHVSTVMLGASKRKQLEENLTAMNVADKIDDDMLTRIDQVLADD